LRGRVVVLGYDLDQRALCTQSFGVRIDAVLELMDVGVCLVSVSALLP
jgi:hypothetical protein